MKCPACGHENTIAAVRCASCNRSLDTNRVRPPTVTVKLSGVAVASALIAVLAWICVVPGVVAGIDRYILHPESALVNLTFLGAMLGVGLGLILGIIGLIEIGTSGGRRTGYGFAVIGASAPVVLVVALMYLPFAAGKTTAGRMTCGTNLAGIGKAMLIYANDYDDKLPVAGGQGTVWGPGLANWRARRRAGAFGLDPNGAGGQATISASFYLLVRYGDVSPKSFVCMGERGVKAFDPTKYRIDGNRLTDVWDFGPNPAKHCSYAYQQPYGDYALTTSSEPGVAVAADHNPWTDSAKWKARDFSAFKPDASAFRVTADQARLGNAKAHITDGQNVLFLDSHVEFMKRPIRKVGHDNIYTSWDGADTTRGLPPVPYESQPADARDSLLVNDPPQGR